MGADILNSAKSQDRLSGSGCIGISGFLQGAFQAADRHLSVIGNKCKGMERGHYFFKFLNKSLDKTEYFKYKSHQLMELRDGMLNEMNLRRTEKRRFF